jgi:hypothetical protein
MSELREIYESLVKNPSDINEHLPTLKGYAEECDHVTEMGVRGACSTWAFLCAGPKALVSYDIEDPARWGVDLDRMRTVASLNNVDFKFVQANVLETEIESTDLLFLDTWHVYQQVKEELRLHASKVKKYIAFHDTVSFGAVGESHGYEGINRAISEFLNDNPEWKFEREFLNNNGLLVIKRRQS